jgi:hypothetical protein
MARIVPHGHVVLDPAEELVELDVEVGRQDGQRPDGRGGPPTLDRADVGAGERLGDLRLAEPFGQATAPHLMTDRDGQSPLAATRPVQALLQNS